MNYCTNCGKQLAVDEHYSLEHGSAICDDCNGHTDKLWPTDSEFPIRVEGTKEQWEYD
jgi:hypothetical protein